MAPTKCHQPVINPARCSHKLRSSVRYIPKEGCGKPMAGRALSRRRAEGAVAAIERQEWLDTPSYRIEHVLGFGLNLLGGRAEQVRNALHGTRLGEPLHPVLNNIPLGAWGAAIVLDSVELLQGRPVRSGQTARACVGVGIVGGLAASLTGLADWQYTHDRPRRSGLVHGLLNVCALGLFTSSWRSRRPGRQRRGQLASGVGYLMVLASGHLGGTLVHRHQIGVDHSDHGLEPPRFVAVLPDRDLPEGVPTHVQAGGVGVILLRHEGQVVAVGEHCPHLGAPMVDGWLYENTLVCPWHGSRFDVGTGAVVAGPAVAPLPCYQTRLRDGQIELRRRTPDEELAHRGAAAQGQRRGAAPEQTGAGLAR